MLVHTENSIYRVTHNGDEVTVQKIDEQGQDCGSPIVGTKLSTVEVGTPMFLSGLPGDKFLRTSPVVSFEE
ncbi:MAG: hypothetical protein AB199_02815 [Parcubacteria bacterium C7867-004]|nr:MAG: hypothetical protein AB199_02815 [Parcubacteria bacterium C7867-004]